MLSILDETTPSDAISFVRPGVCGRGGAFDRTRSAHDLGGRSGDVALDVSSEAGEVIDAASSLVSVAGMLS